MSLLENNAASQIQSFWRGYRQNKASWRGYSVRKERAVELLSGIGSQICKKTLPLAQQAMDLKVGVNHPFENDEDLSLLHLAVRANKNIGADRKIALVESLLRAGANTEVRDIRGSTPLHAAAYWGDVKVLRLLIDAGAGLTAVENFGETPLHVAARNGNWAATRALIAAGADSTAQDNDGFTPFDLAWSKGKYLAASALLERGPSAPFVAGVLGISAVGITLYMNYLQPQNQANREDL